VVNLICQTDQVGDYLAVVLSVDAVDCLIAGICHLLSILRQFDLRYKLSGVSVSDSSQLVDAAEGRAVLGGNQVCPDAPGVDGGSLHFQAVNEILVQIIGGGDNRIGKACCVQHGL